MTRNKGNNRREFYSKRLAQKQVELADVETQLEESLSKADERKLNKKAESLLKEIEEIENQLSQLDAQNQDPNIRHLNLEKTFQKIDFNEAKKIAQSVNDKFSDASGAILVFLQRSTKQKGEYCIKEVLDLLISDRKIGDDIIGDF